MPIGIVRPVRMELLEEQKRTYEHGVITLRLTLNPTHLPIGPFVISAKFKEAALNIAVKRFKNEHPDKSANPRDYRQPTGSRTRLQK